MIVIVILNIEKERERGNLIFSAQWIKETGLRDRLIPKLFTEKPICTSHSSFISVGTTESYAAFLVIGYGMAISFGIFFLEIIWNKK